MQPSNIQYIWNHCQVKYQIELVCKHKKSDRMKTNFHLRMNDEYRKTVHNENSYVLLLFPALVAFSCFLLHLNIHWYMSGAIQLKKWLLSARHLFFECARTFFHGLFFTHFYTRICIKENVLSHGML